MLLLLSGRYWGCDGVLRPCRAWLALAATAHWWDGGAGAQRVGCCLINQPARVVVDGLGGLLGLLAVEAALLGPAAS